MIQTLLIIGSAIFTLFGAIHAFYTFKDLSKPRYFTPRDPALRKAMQESSIGLHPKINLWQAWLGFNLSHSLALVMFGGAYLYVGIFYSALFSQSPLLQGLSILISAIFLILSLKFWFSKPAIGSAISLACFVLAMMLSYI